MKVKTNVTSALRGAFLGLSLSFAATASTFAAQTGSAATPKIVSGQRSAAVVNNVAYAGGVARITPAALPRAPIPGDLVACAISYSDFLRGRPAAAPDGWVGPYTVGSQDAAQGHLRANGTPGQYLYYRVVRDGDRATLPSFATMMTTGADAPSIGYDCIEVQHVSARHPVYAVHDIDLSGDAFRLSSRPAAETHKSVFVFYAFNQPLTSIEEGTHKIAAASSAPRLAVVAAPEPQTGEQVPQSLRVESARTEASPLRGRALVVTFNPPSAEDGGYSSELPEWADRFADGAASMNIRCNQTIYSGCNDTIITALKDLGVRHVTGIDSSYFSNPASLAPMRELSSAGIDTVAGINTCDSDATIRALLSIPGISYGGVTYPNEIDSSRPRELDCSGKGLENYGTWQNWWARRAPQVYAEIRRVRPDTPILSQSFGGSLAHYCSPAQAQTDGNCSGIGDTTPFQDVVNIHQYAGGHHPLGATGNAHEHCGKTGTLFNFTCYAAFANPAGNQPRWFGERGYNDSAIPERAVATYLPVDEMVERISGFTRYYFFNLVDGPSGFASTGLLTARPDYRRKDQYYALQSLIAALSDKGPTFTPTKPLEYKLSGATRDDFHYLLQFRNGRYAFLIADVVPIWDADSHVPIAEDSHPVTMTFPDPPHNPELYRYDTNGNDPTAGNGGCATPATRSYRFCWQPPQHLAATRNPDGSYSITYRATTALSIVFLDEH